MALPRKEPTNPLQTYKAKLDMSNDHRFSLDCTSFKSVFVVAMFLVHTHKRNANIP